MSFELRDRDLLGRIGRLRTKSGMVETPAFMPVINPVLQAIPPKRMKQDFGADIVITNSYIIRKHFGDIPDLEVHKLLDYDGVVTTDSGAYQILVYGGVEVTQEEIITFQKNIGSDIAVILDIPTGWDVPRETVEYTVDETLKRAELALPLIKDTDSLWVGPVQGGKHLDLVAKSAERIGKMPYQVHALGSPTEVMERYMFPVLVDMTMTAKTHLPPDRPLHLFGAGHPMMFAMAVAMGCDLFDSAAYALFAKDDRYMTNRGTSQLKDLEYFPCSCPVCRRHTAYEVKEMTKGDRRLLLTEHNLHACMTEIGTVKQAIHEGNLWALVETRARSHPQMMSALKTLANYTQEFEMGTPSFKGRGIFYYDYNSLPRPQIARHVKSMRQNYGQPSNRSILILFSSPPVRPFTSYPPFQKLRQELSKTKSSNNATYSFVAAPYGVVPEHLAETYPLSQYEIAEPLDHETIQSTVDNVVDYIQNTAYQSIILVSDDTSLSNHLRQTLIEEVDYVKEIHGDPWSTETTQKLTTILND